MLINCGVYTVLIAIDLPAGLELTTTAFHNTIKTLSENAKK